MSDVWLVNFFFVTARVQTLSVIARHVSVAPIRLRMAQSRV